MLTPDTLLIGWRRNGDYAAKLIGDLSDEQIVHQPAPGMNHPAWVFRHLGAYHPVIETLITGGTPDDPIDHPFGMKSAPQPDAALYGGRSSLADVFAQGHDAIDAALQAAGPGALDRPMPVPRWITPFPIVGSCLGYLMLAHESTHLGQLSAWRRVQGLPSV